MPARLALLVSFVAIGACGDPLLPSYDLSGNTMGTTFNITLVAPPADADLDALREQVYKTLENIEDIASTYREDSELSRFNRNPSIDWIDVTHEFCDMVDAAIAVNKATHGAFDVTVGPLVNLWGFGPGDGEDRIPTDEEIAAALSFVGANQVEADCRQPALIKTSPESMSIFPAGPRVMPSMKSPPSSTAGNSTITSSKSAASCAYGAIMQNKESSR